MANPIVKVRSQTVNNVVAGDQTSPRVMGSAGGDVIVTWNRPGTYLEVFDASGTTVSGEIVLSATASVPPDTIWLQDGTFARFSLTAADTVERYARDGTFLSASPAFGEARDLFQVSTGEIILIVRDGSLNYVGHRLDSSLQPTGSSFTIGAENYQIYEPLAGGGFVGLNWNGETEVQVFAADGSKIGAPLTVPNSELASLTALPDGGFVLNFSRLHSSAGGVSDGSGYGVIARLFNSDGTARTGEFVVNTTTGGHESYSNAAVIDDDLFVITWGTFKMFAQLFHSSGRKIGSEIALPGVGGGWHQHPFGWSLDEWADGFVTASRANEIELTYWQVDRANILIGTAADETFDGGGVAERFMVGFGGNDTYNVDSTGDEVQEAAGEGTDRIITSLNFTIAPGQEIEILQTSNNIATTPLVLTGNTFGQYIYGNYGNNLIDGGGGGDIMLGFAGDDTYVVRDSLDQVRENAGEGFDRVNGIVSYGLLAGQEVEMLAFSNNIGTAALSVTGNEIGQYLYGNYGNNILNGGGGADVMSGFLGDDTYFVDNSGDDVRENIAEGNDRIVTSVSFALRAGQHVEIIETESAAGTGALELTGNELAQTITGNAGNNVLTAGGGADILRGLTGDDLYFITPETIIQEFAGEGSDRVFVSGSYTLAGSEIEVLTPADEFGTQALNMTGNSFGQYVYGNDGANRIDGGGGGDVLVGRGGDDLLFVRNAADQIREDVNDGFDRVLAFTSWRANAGAQIEMITTDDNLATTPINLTGNEFAQYVYGNAGNNTVGGGAGKDVLNGLGGTDFFLFDTALNTGFTANHAALADTANVDRIDGFGADDRIALSGALFGFTPGALPAGAFSLGTMATDADDRILWDAASRTLLFDPDGTGAQAAQMIAVLSDPFNLDSTFIIVV